MKSPDTRRSLLLRVRDREDDTAWRDFVNLYAPLIFAYARRRGLQDADAADVAQQVLHAVALALPDFDYDPAVGTFRGWLFTITRNQVFKSLNAKRRLPVATGDSALQEILREQPDHREDEQQWNDDHYKRLFVWAAEKAKVEFRDRTWDAFWAVAVEGKQPAVVADELGMSVGAVYIAKSRVTVSIRQIIETIEDS